MLAGVWTLARLARPQSQVQGLCWRPRLVQCSTEAGSCREDREQEVRLRVASRCSEVSSAGGSEVRAGLVARSRLTSSGECCRAPGWMVARPELFASESGVRLRRLASSCSDTAATRAAADWLWRAAAVAAAGRAWRVANLPASVTKQLLFLNWTFLFPSNITGHFDQNKLTSITDMLTVILKIF